jgi:drug/metabolite transporter (DMT)-like permease
VESKQIKANIILLLTAFIWGFTFVAQRASMLHVGPYLFNALRFTLGTLSLIPIWFFLKNRMERFKHTPLRTTLICGLFAGIAIFAGSSFQQVGLVTTTAGKSGFITGLYVIIVPVIGMLWGNYSGLNTWLGAFFSAIGLYFLCMTESLTISWGDTLTLFCAVCFAFHVILIAIFSQKNDPILLSMFQFAVCACLSLTVALCIEPFQIDGILNAGPAICFCGFFSVGVGYTLQVVGQLNANPTHAAIILCLEGVFAAICGWLFLEEQMTSRSISGAILMVLGMIISHINFSPSGRFLARFKR